ncbi:MAG: hypothetical protein RR258_05950, partial [Alistipes sp.]
SVGAVFVLLTRQKDIEKSFLSYKTLHDPRACREVEKTISAVTLRPLDRLEDREPLPLRPLDKLEDREPLPLRPLDRLEDREPLSLRPLDRLEDREFLIQRDAP